MFGSIALARPRFRDKLKVLIVCTGLATPHRSHLTVMRRENSDTWKFEVGRPLGCETGLKVKTSGVIKKIKNKNQFTKKKFNSIIFLLFPDPKNQIGHPNKETAA